MSHIQNDINNCTNFCNMAFEEALQEYYADGFLKGSPGPWVRKLMANNKTAFNDNDWDALLTAYPQF